MGASTDHSAASAGTATPTPRPGGRRGSTAAGAAVVLSLLLLLLLAPKLLHVLQLHGIEPEGVIHVLHGSGTPTPPPPPGECGKLSKELLERYAKNGTVMITFTDHLMFKLFGSTWLHNVLSSNISYWLLAVADNRTADLVLSRGVRQCFMAEEMEVDDLAAEFKWGGRTWLLHTWQKVLTVRHVHHLGFNVVHSDMDVVWFRDPLPYFLQQYSVPDYFVSMDPITTQNQIGDPGPEAGVTVHHYMNTGVYFLRCTPGGRALIDKWYEIRQRSQLQGWHDQDGLYKYLTLEQKESVNRSGRYTSVLGGLTKLAQMPATQFQNGYSHCINQIHKVHHLQPYETHFVWVDGNNNGKMHRMRESMYFQDPDWYYRSPGQGDHVVVPDQVKGQLHASFQLSGTEESERSGRRGFLSVELQHIETPSGFNAWRNISTDSEPMTSHHLHSLELQLTELYHALALALALNRTLILPKLQCWCIQNWFENPLCRLPGELHTHFPINCPADYVLYMNKLYSLEVQGRRIPIREYSFLDNPRTEANVKDNPLSITFTPAAAAAAAAAAAVAVAPLQYSAAQHSVQLPPGSSYSALAQTLEPYQGQYSRMHVKAPLGLLVNTLFTEEGRQAAFDQAMSQLPVRWCCRPDVVIKAHPELKNDHQLVMSRGTA